MTISQFDDETIMFAAMLQNYFVKQGILAVIFSAALLATLPNFKTLEESGAAVWYTLLFINALFAVLYFIGNESLKAQSHNDFMTIFGVLFAVKVGVTLAWLLAAIFVFQLSSTTYVLAFFALYLSYTFLWAWQLFSQGRKKQPHRRDA